MFMISLYTGMTRLNRYTILQGTTLQMYFLTKAKGFFKLKSNRIYDIMEQKLR